MKPWITHERVTVGTTQLTLQERDGEFCIRANGHELMSSQRHASEDVLAEAAGTAVTTAGSRVLVGGLGLGYTLRGVLDRAPADAKVDIAELVPEVVKWNRTLLAHLARNPLGDPRVTVREGDVNDVIRSANATYNAILLDIDTGPSAVSVLADQSLYSNKGIGRCLNALKKGGILVTWSAGPDEAYLARLGKAGFDAEQTYVAKRTAGRSQHVLFIGRKR